MKKIIYILSASLLLVLFSGCAGKHIPEYSISADNFSTLEQYKEIKVNVGDFSGIDDSSSDCRLGLPIKTSNDQKFKDYIKQAFISELKIARMYDKNSNIILTANINKIYGSTFGSAYWEIKGTFKSSNGKSIEVNTKRNYESAWNAEIACDNMRTAFVPTVRQFINDTLNHKDFYKLLK